MFRDHFYILTLWFRTDPNKEKVMLHSLTSCDTVE